LQLDFMLPHEYQVSPYIRVPGCGKRRRWKPRWIGNDSSNSEQLEWIDIDLHRIQTTWLLSRSWMGIFEMGHQIARAVLNHSPATPKIFSSEFVAANQLAFRWECVEELKLLVLLWRLQRNEPRRLVSERIHIFVGQAQGLGWDEWRHRLLEK